ncbi:hypothetical protein RF11_09950 [Thelohanellus kitauei]|uniref:Uncharacterized protein n=1 Tax=Thelohanellus kitauei TaxID=669202 RepID=A0A0C2IUD4_THEKT|nr:hypothetical protein RF11_09950 [Thelohanellus kitauei]
MDSPENDPKSPSASTIQDVDNQTDENPDVSTSTSYPPNCKCILNLDFVSSASSAGYEIFDPSDPNQIQKPIKLKLLINDHYNFLRNEFGYEDIINLIMSELFIMIT